MIRALVLKEIHQHWLALVLLGLLVTASCGAAAVALVASGELGGKFEILQVFLHTLVPILSLILGNRLITSEYQTRSQLFLEGLPLSRLRFVFVKYVLGLGLLLAAVVSLAGILSVWGMRQENIDLRFLSMILVRATAYTWCVYSYFFVTAFTGRYSIAIYLVSLLSLYFLDEHSELELAQFGPFALVDDRFAFERHDWRVTPLLVTLILSGVMFGLALLLAQLREGSVAAMLGEKMSYREKVLVSGLVLGLFFGLYLYDEQAAKEPFRLLGAREFHEGGVSVAVSTGGEEETPTVQQMGDRIVGELSALRDYLKITEPPPVFVVQRADLDADHYERGELVAAEGLLVRCNFLDPKWDERRFQVWLVRQWLIVASKGRVQYERHRWVLDGLGAFWVYRQAPASDPARQFLELRSAYGGKCGFAATDVPTWLTFRERVGEPIAEAVAWSGLSVLEQNHGAASCRELLRAVLKTDVGGDVRATVYDWKYPLAVLLPRHVGITEPEFCRRWLDVLEANGERHRTQLDALPRMRGHVDYRPLSSNSRAIHYQFASDPPPQRGRFQLRHCELPAFDTEVPHSDIEQDEFDYETQRTGEIAKSVERGTRWFWTFAVDAPALGCDIITGWVREEIP